MIRIVVTPPTAEQAGQPLNFEGLVWHNQSGIVGHAVIQQQYQIVAIGEEGQEMRSKEWRDVPVVLSRDDG